MDESESDNESNNESNNYSLNQKAQKLFKKMLKLSSNIEHKGVIDQKVVSEIIKQWQLYKYLRKDEEEHWKCLCDTDICDVFTMRNIYNGNTADIGNVCIKWFKNSKWDDIVSDVIFKKKSKTKKFRRIVEHESCEICNEIHTVNSEHLKNAHPTEFHQQRLSTAGEIKFTFYKQYKGQKIKDIPLKIIRWCAEKISREETIHCKAYLESKAYLDELKK